MFKTFSIQIDTPFILTILNVYNLQVHLQVTSLVLNKGPGSLILYDLQLLKLPNKSLQMEPFRRLIIETYLFVLCNDPFYMVFSGAKRDVSNQKIFLCNCETNLVETSFEVRKFLRSYNDSYLIFIRPSLR